MTKSSLSQDAESEIKHGEGKEAQEVTADHAAEGG